MPIIEYKCPNCGSGMVYDSVSGMLSCNSCGRKDNIETLEDPLARNLLDEAGKDQYQCKSCGAVITAEPETTATVCSFCGAAVVIGDRLTGKLMPAVVIPFTISKEEAGRAFRKWCKRGLLTPSGFMTADRIKSITGIYVPFWLYDLNNAVEAQGMATKVRVYTKGDYQYTETQHFEVYRKLRANYLRVPVDATEKMNNEIMDKLEPFPYGKMKGFKSPYLAGYIAEKYSFDEQQLFPRVKHKIAPYIEAYLQSTVTGYTSVSFAHKDIQTSMAKADYALLPVWIVRYDYNRTEYTFAMNGQTGKVVGKPPISKGKIMAWFSGISAASLLLLKLASLAMGGGFL